jgi:hypothetical protein
MFGRRKLLVDFNVCLSALENKLEDIEQRFGYALSASEAERMKADPLGIVKLSAEHVAAGGAATVSDGDRLCDRRHAS